MNYISILLPALSNYSIKDSASSVILDDYSESLFLHTGKNLETTMIINGYQALEIAYDDLLPSMLKTDLLELLNQVVYISYCVQISSSIFISVVDQINFKCDLYFELLCNISELNPASIAIFADEYVISLI